MNVPDGSDIIRDQLPWVSTVNSMIVEAERLRIYGGGSVFIMAVATIYDKISAEKQLEKEAGAVKRKHDAEMLKHLVKINRKWTNQSSRCYQRLKASDAKTGMRVKLAAELLHELQRILSAHDMLLKTYGGEHHTL